jgi:hypothetical protein
MPTFTNYSFLDEFKTSNDVIMYFVRHGHNADVKAFHCNLIPQGVNFHPYELVPVSLQTLGRIVSKEMHKDWKRTQDDSSVPCRLNEYS